VLAEVVALLLLAKTVYQIMFIDQAMAATEPVPPILELVPSMLAVVVVVVVVKTILLMLLAVVEVEVMGAALLVQ
jgi:hypothetical protein